MYICMYMCIYIYIYVTYPEAQIPYMLATLNLYVYIYIYVKVRLHEVSSMTRSPWGLTVRLGLGLGMYSVAEPSKTRFFFGFSEASRVTVDRGVRREPGRVHDLDTPHSVKRNCLMAFNRRGAPHSETLNPKF